MKGASPRLLSRVVPIAATLAVALLSACASDEGRVQSWGPAPPPKSSTIVSGNGSGGGGGGGALVPGGAAYMPPAVTPQPGQNYPRTIQESGAGPAVLSLYKQAQDARANGHPDQAEALLERAVHIDPRNPFVWQALAGVHMDQKQYDQVEGPASKSNAVARGNPYVEAGNWRLIASARQARGDSGGAVQAQARADDIARALSN